MNYDKTDNVGKATRIIIYPKGEKLYRKYAETTDPQTYIDEIKNGTLSLSFVTSNAEADKPDPLDCIGEYVQNFDVTLPEGNTEGTIKSVEITLKMHEGKGIQAQSYMASDIFSLRNSMYKNAEEESEASESESESSGDGEPGGGEPAGGDT